MKPLQLSSWNLIGTDRQTDRQPAAILKIFEIVGKQISNVEKEKAATLNALNLTQKQKESKKLYTASQP